jgi:ribosomal protein S27E
MKINCLACGHKVDLDDVYDDFEGQVKCFACTALLEIKTEEGKLKSVQFVKLVPRPGVLGKDAAI